MPDNRPQKFANLLVDYSTNVQPGEKVGIISTTAAVPILQALYARVSAEPALAVDIAPGVPRAELGYAAEIEDAMTAEDFLLRRTKLHLLLDAAGRDAVGQWFAART